ncbi:MAG: carboxypeptidase-like regulatory domain-containing protein, partial [Bacteroidota bacterium]
MARFLLLLLALAPLHAVAQTATVAGVVQSAETGEPLPGASVLLSRLGAEADTPRGRATTAEGSFVFTDVTPGRYTIRASFVGYLATTDTLDLQPGDETESILELAEQRLADVVVEAGGEREPIQAGRTALRPADIASLPGPDPSGDLLQALTFQPGVVALGDRGGQLTVRG